MSTLSLLDFRLSVIDALPVIRMIPKVLSVTDDEWCFLRLTVSHVSKQPNERKPFLMGFSVTVL
jgi:hypothetical protein